LWVKLETTLHAVGSERHNNADNDINQAVSTETRARSVSNAASGAHFISGEQPGRIECAVWRRPDTKPGCSVALRVR
jgi:hypothetical protein